MKVYRLLSLIPFLCVSGCAQLLTFGVQGGVPTQTPLGRNNSQTPFAIGPTVTARLSSALSVQSGLLFDRMGSNNNNAAFIIPENSVTLKYDRWRGHALEIPLLLKYSFLSEHRAWRPFLTAGAAVRRTSIDYRGVTSIFSDIPISPVAASSSNSTKWNLDPVLGAGFSFRAGRIHLDPEVRYSNWGAGSNSVLRKNQVNFLLGFRL